MIDTFNQLLDTLLPFSPMLAPTVLAFFMIYATWYFSSLKTFAPMTREEAKLLWKIHKKETGCTAKKLHEIKRKNKIVGFKCECGYKYLKKRPIMQ
ncbi:MAG: hypothetical protein ACP5IM_03975 [Candidatus Bathyarchaeia archaeon]